MGSTVRPPSATGGGVVARTTPADRAVRWVAVVAWAALPFTLGALIADALADAGRTAQLLDSGAAWVVWAAGLVALLVPTTVSLTVVRLVVPGAVAAALLAGAAVAARDVGALDLVHAAGTALAALAAVMVLSAPVGAVFVNGSAYGDERRYLLRAPSALLFGPIELAWLVVVAGALAGPLLLGAERWVAGGAALVVGWPAAVVAARAVHGLHRRWFVLVPTGTVLHDFSAVTESVMAPRRQLAHLGPAAADSTALDLTAGAAGLALEARFVDPIVVSPRPGRRPGTGAVVEPVDAAAILFTPTRPGRLLAEAERRRLPVG
ncbi:MAG: hypothetical protein R2699_12990 [Acidimicrobiales bacterium]|nr:hypothetical protein [Acidimicrobiales bacterium]